MTDSNSNQKKKTIAMIGTLLCATAFTGYTYFEQGNSDDYISNQSTTIASNDSNVRTETLNDGTVKKTVIIEGPQRSNSIKTMKQVVNDYIESSPNPEQALASLNAAYSIPAAENLMHISKLQAERAEFEFKAKEWKAKTEQMEEFGVSSLQSAKEPEVDQSMSQMGYFKGSSTEKQVATSNKKDKEIQLDDFVLLGIVGGKTAKLSRFDREYSVKTGYVIHGDITVKVTKDSVSLSKGANNINLYLD